MQIRTNVKAGGIFVNRCESLAVKTGENLFADESYVKVSTEIFMYDVRRKDLDNMWKFLKDAMQGGIYKNDRMVVTGRCRKDPAAMYRSHYDHRQDQKGPCR